MSQFVTPATSSSTATTFLEYLDMTVKIMQENRQWTSSNLPSLLYPLDRSSFFGDIIWLFGAVPVFKTLLGYCQEDLSLPQANNSNARGFEVRRSNFNINVFKSTSRECKGAASAFPPILDNISPGRLSLTVWPVWPRPDSLTHPYSFVRGASAASEMQSFSPDNIRKSITNSAQYSKLAFGGSLCAESILIGMYFEQADRAETKDGSRKSITAPVSRVLPVVKLINEAGIQNDLDNLVLAARSAL
ncbi:hypothetical protein C8J56DRAFT_893472 [Mycena floridula]|nr:hypothetical protein C8J56DRAFT_893472 [Mycena floridula]